MRKRIAMVLLGLSLAVGTPAATNMFPTVSVQTVQAAGHSSAKEAFARMMERQEGGQV